MRLAREIVIIISCLMAGCTGTSATRPDTSSDIRQPADLADCDRKDPSDHSLKPDLVAKLLAEDRFHAALAQLDALPQQTAYTRYLRAHTLRLLDRRSEAEEMYQTLLESCMEGYARHGLGLLSTGQGDITAAQNYLLQAREQLPLDPRVRNDYGYVLLLAGQPQQAYFEFMTALELKDAGRQPRHNALLTLIVLDRMEQAKAFAKRMELTDSDIARAQVRARQLRRDWSAGYQTAGAGRSARAGMSDTLPLELETNIEVTRER